MPDEEKREETKGTCKIFTVSFPTEPQPPVGAVNEHDETETPRDFEEAAEATGYGLFNYLLLLAALPGGFASVFDSTTMSYVLPSAECDLRLTLFHKGVLNAVTYTGMMSSAFIWGFLADVRGRRSLLIWGYLADSICNVMCSMSQSFYVLAFFKFFTGFIINGPFAISMTYLAEFHSSKHRAKTLLWCSLFPSLGIVVLPGLAWLIIPQSWSFTLFDGAFVYNSWRIFILVCSMPSLLACLALMYFPESPKFLMSQGRNAEAIKIFRKMYSMNTGKSPETFAVKELCQERQTEQINDTPADQKSASICEKMRNGWAQIKPLFKKPHLARFLLIITIQFGSILSLNTLRLWMPQLFAMMENFDYANYDYSLGNPTLCEIITMKNDTDYAVNSFSNDTVPNTCIATVVSNKVYINSIIISGTSVIGYTFAGKLVNLIGKKVLMQVLYVAAVACILGLNWSSSSDVTLTILSLYTAATNIAITSIISFIVDLMPTSLRTMAVSLTMCVGRGGATIGNLLFPILLSEGCMSPFAFVAGFLVVCIVLTTFIPRPPTKLT
ncbi:synaptic vesicle glycoprotein 2A isoform X1 [Neodiprion lecontei]|uniref:Synaptic vesicle glycoprotein 2A isoform X1 n=1 Tax=Neodiprion lecontei TaxID=441921 RepID=A0ABM3G0Z1_NEOLC|nr:synaptic vesicle glycoprotein 2A isoform X1 [Neodiprion lecontei]